MGNTFASTKPPVSDPSFKESDPVRAEEKILNPGSFEDLHKSTAEVFPSVFDGVVVSLHKRLSEHFQVLHTFTLTKKPGRYRFGASCDAGPTLAGEGDASGNLSASVSHRFGSRCGVQLRAQMAGGRCLGAEARADVRGERCTTSFAALNPELLRMRGAFVAQHLHAASRRLAVGAELACQRSDRLPAGGLVALALAARYVGDDFEASATVGATCLRLCFCQRASEQLRFGVETEVNLRLGESVTRLGYRVDLPDLQFRASLDSDLNAEAALEKRLDPMPFTLTIGGRLDHKKNAFGLGVGFVGVIA